MSLCVSQYRRGQHRLSTQQSIGKLSHIIFHQIHRSQTTAFPFHRGTECCFPAARAFSAPDLFSAVSSFRSGAARWCRLVLLSAVPADPECFLHAQHTASAIFTTGIAAGTQTTRQLPCHCFHSFFCFCASFARYTRICRLPAPADGSRFPPDYPDHSFFLQSTYSTWHYVPLPSSPCWYSTLKFPQNIFGRKHLIHKAQFFSTLCHAKPAYTSPVLMQETIHPFPGDSAYSPGGPVL